MLGETKKQFSLIRAALSTGGRAKSKFLSVVRLFKFFVLLGFFAGVVTAAGTANDRRTSISLNGAWEFQRDQAAPDAWKKVEVPSTFQDHEGTNFHGVGWYRKSVAGLTVPAGKRLLLRFQAAATEAEVWWNGERLGEHLGGWTPFRFDVTELIRKSAGAPQNIRVRLDEKVGHNTQGFLPIIEPHFGGLWQDVSLQVVPDTYLDDLRALTVGDPQTSELRLELPLAGKPVAGTPKLSLRCRLRGEEQWTELGAKISRAGETLTVRAPLPGARLWSPESPNLYEIEAALPGRNGDVLRTRAAFRSMEAWGQEFRLNGRPLSIRGALNWGYSGPMLAPNPGEKVWRAELEFARSHGFNLMKFCLWVPPQRYLELADEMGVLAWMEYPTWHPDFTGKFLQPLRREFREFFEYDRNHPAVVLRSLTCETGPSADLEVIRSLYNEAHATIPGALVEDDSSWIGWNRIHDFYDDHPYGNNHTWVKTLSGFNEYILGHGLKPLVLGETTSADTWIDRNRMLGLLGDKRPWWAPVALDDSGEWLKRMQALAGPGGLAELRPDSLRYGLLMRKYQIEAYRREIPYGGYVITVLRDFPAASMGLLDYFGEPKWSPEEWAWQGNTMCLLKTEADRRGFASGERLKGDILLSHFGNKSIHDGRLEVKLLDLDRPQAAPLAVREDKDIAQNPGTLASLAELDWSLPEVERPVHLSVQAVLSTPDGEFRNEWPLWVVPVPKTNWLSDVRAHGSVAAAIKAELFSQSSAFDASRLDGVVVASHFDDPLARYLEEGGRVLFLPDGQQFSLPLSAHWFLRGGPYIPESALTRQVQRELLVELQHFDLAADVVPNVPQLDAMDPLLWLWDTHDQKTVKTHGIIFETRVGKGRLLVSAARHGGSQNAAGRWLLSVLLDLLRSDQAPRHALPEPVWEYAKARMHADQTNLVSRPWKFKADPDSKGIAEGWQSATTRDTDWKDIRIGNWWEPQGYPALDGWAWYRLWVDIPAGWNGRHVYLSFEGVDDMYELYVNGNLAGKVGDIATRKDALNDKTSHDITALVKPGEKALLAVRVYDWYGYGGIFRPVTLGTLPFNPGKDFLK